MSRPRRIRTPLRQRVKRLYLSATPALVFAAAVLATVVLWDRHAATPLLVGEVHAVRYDFGLPADGRLLTLQSGGLEPFDEVRRGDVVARLDDRPVLAELQALEAELNAIAAELGATAARVRQERADREHAFMDEARRLAVDQEQLRLDVLDRRREIETDRVLLERFTTELEAIESARAHNAETEHRERIARLERDEIARRITSGEVVLRAAEQQLEAATQRLARQPLPPNDELDAQLEPIRGRLAGQEALMGVLHATVAQLTVRAPDDGVVAAVHYRPGQTVPAGMPVLTVASPRTDHVVVYLPERHRRIPEAGAPVRLQTRDVRPRTVVGRVGRIGAQVELVPPHHLKDPNVPAWGLPVRVELPPDAALIAGELVDVSIGDSRGAPLIELERMLERNTRRAEKESS